MEKQLSTRLILFLIIGSQLQLLLLFVVQAESQSTLISLTKKVTTLHFYLQDVVGGDNRTVWSVAKCNLTDVLPSGFGKVLVLDNLVTSGPDINSGQVGRMQGTVTLSDIGERALEMVLNLVFTEGEFKGSTLAILGRNPLGAEIREVPIVGGTGVFRMATGYILTTTYFRDPAGVHSVYEYNALVFHYHMEEDPSVLFSRW